MSNERSERKTLHHRLKANTNIPEPHRTHRKLITEIWVNSQKSKDGQSKDEQLTLISEIVHLIVGTTENPFEAAIELHKHSCDYSLENNDRIASRILLYFEKWLNKRDDRETLERKFLTIDLQKIAFDVATKETTISLPEIFKIFRIHEENQSELKSFLNSQIQLLCNQLKFKESLQVVDTLSWHERYSIELFLVPCFLQSRAHLVEEFLKKSPGLMFHFVQWLDSFVSLRRTQLAERLKRYKELGVMPVEELLYDKTLERYISRLLCAYKIDPKLTPNFTRARLHKRIIYVIQKFFQFDTPKTFETRYNYFGNLFNCVKEDNQMKRFLLVVLLQKGHHFVGEATWWMLMLRAENAYWLPHELRTLIQSNPVFVAQQREEINKFCLLIRQDETAIPKFLHGDYSICLVDNSKLDLFRQIPDLLLKEQLIGIDAEWEQGVAFDKIDLLQIACSNCVYLLDFVSLIRFSTLNEWRALLEALLTGPAIKLVFSFDQDLINLFNTFPSLIDLKSKMTNVFCLNRLANKIINANKNIIDVSDLESISMYTGIDGENVMKNHQFSLSYLYKKIVGKVLDKEQQTSPWSYRPLSSRQTFYAAQDAYCLREIYFELQKRIREADLNFESFFLNNKGVLKRPKAEKQKVDVVVDMEKLEKEMREFLVVTGNELAETRSLKLIFDKGFGNLETYLRQMGVDVLKISGDLTAAQLAERHPDRHLVTNEKAFGKMSSGIKRILEKRVFFLSAQPIPLIEAAELIFKNFMLLPKRSDLFSRCMHCNESSLLLIPRPILHFVYHFTVEVQGIYAREEEFFVEDWLPTLENLSTERFGVEATVDFIEAPYKIVAKCVNGDIDLNAGVIIGKNGRKSVQIAIQKCPSNVFRHSTIPYFHVCSGCGQVFWNEALGRFQSLGD